MHPRSVNGTTVVVRAHDNSHGGNKSGQVDDQHQEERRRQQHQKFTSMICSTCEKVEKVREASANDVTFFEKKNENKCDIVMVITGQTTCWHD